MTEERESLRDKILQIVNSNGPIKNVDLALEVTKIFHKEELSGIFHVLEELVESGEIEEIEYTLASMPYRVKSIYFPKGTTIKIVSA